ncbi:hypothetical protein ZIOFF_017693 [Zingiber officinale]|uniref:U1-type domain-containing protein n=1 Tax=Zingiber officinale TaxID=94328 RepID=A0A8J5LLJ1_ZINOF|nr:hypothetical protein ZIOFF_017693 [Zingiber officinale]
MGGKCPSRKVFNELLKQAEEAAAEKTLPLDEDLPGMGQFYCLHCDRYFAGEDVRQGHFSSKRHKKRYFRIISLVASLVKEMMGPAPHTQLDAELAAGMGMPDNGPKLMTMSFT